MMAEMSPSVPFMLMPKYTKDKDAAGMVGDVGFDPLGLMDKRADMATAEIKNGRLAMLAITGMAVQEFIYGTPVIQQTPQYFKPFFL